MVQLQDWIQNSGNREWGSRGNHFNDNEPGQFQGRTFRQVSRGTTFLGTALLSALGLSTLANGALAVPATDASLSTHLGRRSQCTHEVIGGIPPQSVFPQATLSLSLHSSNYFTICDPLDFTYKITENGQETLPNWMELNIDSIESIETIDMGGVRGVHVVSNFAYVADSINGLRIVDVSNPNTPTLAGSYNTPDNAQGVHVAGGFAYVADGNSGLRIVDVSNPNAPTFAGSYNTPHNA